MLTLDEVLDKVHPHACGEDLASTPNARANVGSPPRVWGRRNERIRRDRRRGFTPTRVGKTSIWVMLPV